MFTAIIPAAGSGRRMGREKNKLLLSLKGQPLIAHTLRAIKGCSLVSEIILAVQPEDEDEMERLGEPFGVRLVHGGKTRQESVENALRAARCDWVMVHDGARPLVSREKLEEVAKVTLEKGAAILAIPVKDTLKEAENQCILRTVPRDRLWAAQTPQCFRRSLLLEAYERADFEATDDASLVERWHPVSLVPGEETNFKVTTPLDLLIAEKLLAH